MSTLQQSPEYISLRQYCEQLQAQNKAKKNQIDTLYKQIERLNNRNIISTVTSSLVPAPCQKCNQKQVTIMKLKGQIKEIQTLKAKERSEYETKIRNSSMNKTYENRTIISSSSKSNQNSDFEELRKSQQSLKKRIEELKYEKNKKIQELQLELTKQKTQFQKSKVQYENKIKKLSEKSSSQRVSYYSSSSHTQSKDIKITELTNKNQQLQKKYEQLISSKNTNNISQTDINRLKLTNAQLEDKVDFLQKKLLQIEGWNKTLRQEILMKMHPSTNYTEIHNSHRISNPFPNTDEIVKFQQNNTQFHHIHNKPQTEYLKIAQNTPNFTPYQTSQPTTVTPRSNVKISYQANSSYLPNYTNYEAQNNRNSKIFKYEEQNSNRFYTNGQYQDMNPPSENTIIQQSIKIEEEKKIQSGNPVSKIFDRIFSWDKVQKKSQKN